MIKNMKKAGKATDRDRSVFLNDMDLQIIKIDGFDEIVLPKAGFVMPLEFLNGRIKPDGFAQVKAAAYLVYGVKYLVGACVV